MISSLLTLQLRSFSSLSPGHMRRSPHLRCAGWLESAQILVDFHLQFSDFIQRPLGEDGKVTGVFRQNPHAIRVEDTLHPPHLLDGLIQLFGIFDHGVIFKTPFRKPICPRTCWKNATAFSCSFPRKTPNRAASSASVQSWTPTGSRPFSSSSGIGIGWQTYAAACARSIYLFPQKPSTVRP